jgi:hypothetical protein
MRIDITLGLDEIVRALQAATPLRVHFGGDDETRWVELEHPSEVTLVPDVGLRVVADGHIRYEIAGFKLPFAIRRAQLLLEPAIVRIEGGHERLEFKISVEQVDLENVPGVAERVLEKVVNDALAGLDLHWGFGRALDLAITIPPRFEPLDELIVRPGTSQVTITRGELRLSLGAEVGLTRSAERPTRG